MTKYIDQAAIDEFRERCAIFILFNGNFDLLTARQARVLVDWAAQAMVTICADYGWIDPSLVGGDDQERPS